MDTAGSLDSVAGVLRGGEVQLRMRYEVSAKDLPRHRPPLGPPGGGCKGLRDVSRSSAPASYASLSETSIEASLECELSNCDVQSKLT